MAGKHCFKRWAFVSKEGDVESHSDGDSSSSSEFVKLQSQSLDSDENSEPDAVSISGVNRNSPELNTGENPETETETIDQPLCDNNEFPLPASNSDSEGLDLQVVSALTSGRLEPPTDPSLTSSKDVKPSSDGSDSDSGDMDAAELGSSDSGNMEELKDTRDKDKVLVDDESSSDIEELTYEDEEEDMDADDDEEDMDSDEPEQLGACGGIEDSQTFTSLSLLKIKQKSLTSSECDSDMSDIVRLDPGLVDDLPSTSHQDARLPIDLLQVSASSSTSSGSGSRMGSRFIFIQPLPTYMRQHEHRYVYPRANEEDNQSLPDDVDDRCESDISGVSHDSDPDLSSVSYNLEDLELFEGDVVRSYKHRPNSSLNALLTTLALLTLCTTLGIGIGHYFGSKREVMRQSQRTVRIQEIQDEYIHCLRQRDLYQSKAAFTDQKKIAAVTEIWKEKYEELIIEKVELQHTQQELEQKMSGYLTQARTDLMNQEDDVLNLEAELEELREEYRSCHLQLDNLDPELNQNTDPALTEPSSILDLEEDSGSAALAEQLDECEDPEVPVVDPERVVEQDSPDPEQIDPEQIDEGYETASDVDPDYVELREMEEIVNLLRTENEDLRRQVAILRYSKFQQEAIDIPSEADDLILFADEPAIENEPTDEQVEAAALHTEETNKEEEAISIPVAHVQKFIDGLSNNWKGVKKGLSAAAGKTSVKVEAVADEMKRFIAESWLQFQDKAGSDEIKSSLWSVVDNIKNSSSVEKYQDFINKTKQNVSDLNQKIKVVWDQVRNMTEDFMEQNKPLGQKLGDTVHKQMRNMKHYVHKGWKKAKRHSRKLNKYLDKGWKKVKKNLAKKGWLSRNGQPEKEKHHEKKKWKKMMQSKTVRKEDQLHQQQHTILPESSYSKIPEPLEDAKVTNNKLGRKQKQSSNINHEKYAQYWQQETFEPDDFLEEGFFEGNNREWTKHQRRVSKLHGRLQKLNEEIFLTMDDDDNDDMYEDFDELQEDFDGDHIPERLHNWLTCQVRWWKSRLVRKHSNDDVVKGCARYLMRWQLKALCSQSCAAGDKKCRNRMAQRGLHQDPFCQYYQSVIISSCQDTPGQEDGVKNLGCQINQGSRCNFQVTVDEDNQKESGTIDNVYGTLRYSLSIDDEDEDEEEDVEEREIPQAADNNNNSSMTEQSKSSDWFFQRAEDRESHRHDTAWMFRRENGRNFQRNKPWYYRRSEKRAEERNRIDDCIGG